MCSIHVLPPSSFVADMSVSAVLFSLVVSGIDTVAIHNQRVKHVSF